jgi:hypothetical protein
MKEKIQASIKAYEAWKNADRIWDTARKTLERDLKKYAKRKSLEFSAKHGLEKYYKHDDLFLVSLDGGCKAKGWKPEGGFFSSLMLHREGLETTWFEPTLNGTWMKIIMPDFRGKIGEEIPGDQGPISLGELEKLASEMTEESGVRFHLHGRDFSSEFENRSFEKITFLNGTTHEAPEEEEDNDDY